MKHSAWLLCLLVGCAPSSPSESPDAGPAEPAVGTVEAFASLPVSTEGLAFGRDATGADVLFVGGGDRIMKITSDGTVSTHAELPGPLGMALLPDGNLVVCGKASGAAGTSDMPGALWRVTPDGMATELLGPPNASFKLTNNIAVAPDGSLLLTDSGGNRVYRLDADGSNLQLVTDVITYPNGVAFSVDGQAAYVASWDSVRVYRLPYSNGQYGAPEVLLDTVETVDGIVVMADGDLVLVSTGEGVVDVTLGSNTKSTLAPPSDFAVAANGAFGVGAFGARWLYVTDLFRPELQRVYVGQPGLELPVR